ncbi:MAG: L-threonylcarbamoyladenylate synthase [Silvanigrellaceae bacterium]
MTLLLNNDIDQSLEAAAEHIRHGGLVAFPTETVYGLGADARHAQAVRRIYEVKRRPATDPLIVHVPSVEFAEEMIDPRRTSTWQRSALRILADAFWPGPLTLILPAHPENISFDVTSGTGLVGLRRPAHPLAQKFLEHCRIPVAAPSANLFGHVSPTTAEHVLADFPHVDNLWILDGGRCGFGIESSVVRLNEDETVDVLRRGGVGPARLMQILRDTGLSDRPETSVRVLERFVEDSSSTTPHAAPGQLLVHYAPRIPASMVSIEERAVVGQANTLVSEDKLKKTIVLDFGSQLNGLSRRVGFYRNLSSVGDSREAAYSLFDALRWAENCAPESGQLWIFNPKDINHHGDELFLALQDRVIRAASGCSTKLVVTPDFGPIYASIR